MCTGTAHPACEVPVLPTQPVRLTENVDQLVKDAVEPVEELHDHARVHLVAHLGEPHNVLRHGQAGWVGG